MCAGQGMGRFGGMMRKKSKYEKKKKEKEQDSHHKRKKERGMEDCAADAHAKYESKRSVKHDDRETRANIKTQKTVKQANDKDMHGLERHARQRIGLKGTYQKVQIFGNTDEKYRDDWRVGEVGMENRHREHRNACKERLWEDSLQLEKGNSNKERIDAQKRSSGKYHRQRNGLILEKPRDRQRKELGGKIAEEQEQEVIPPAVIDESKLTKKDVIKNHGLEGGRHMDGYGEQALRQGKISERKPKCKWNHELAEAKERKGRVLLEADGTSIKVFRATSSQNCVRGPSVTVATNLSPVKNQSRGSQGFDSLDVAIAESDHTRPRCRPTEELVDLFHEEKALHEKFGQGDTFETSVIMSSSSGTRWSREQNWSTTDAVDQGKRYLGCDEEVRSREARSLMQDERRHVLPHKRAWDDRQSLSPMGPFAQGVEELASGSGLMLSNSNKVLKRKHPNFTQGTESAKTRCMDGRRRREGSQLNRKPTDGPSASQMPANCLSGHSSSLPPPPPYRPGVDNSGVVGSSTIFPQGSNSRENGRYNRKIRGTHSRRSEIAGPSDSWGGFGVGRWNTHSQVPAPGPGPGPIFPPFPQMGSGVFLGMGQQFHVPQMHGPHGTGLSADMGFGGARLHKGDGGAGFPGHCPVMGWPRFSDGNETQGPLSGLVDRWERPGQYLHDCLRFEHVDWVMRSQGMSGGGWEDAGRGQEGDASLIVTELHKESLYQGGIEEVASHGDPHMESIEAVEDTVPDTVEVSPVHSLLKDASRASKRFHQRMQTMLLQADVSAEFAGIELYQAYLNLLPPLECKQREAGTEDHLIVSDAFIDEDLEYEVDVEAQELLDTDSLHMFLPSFSNSAYKDALRIFQQRPAQQDRVQKSAVGSFVLPQCSLIIKLPILDGINIESSEEQLCAQIGLGLEPEGDQYGTVSGHG
eukprot:c23930_g2_i2 orf=553-3321(+)